MRDKDREYATLTFRCPPELVEGLDRLAAYEGISRSDVARRAAIQAVRNVIPTLGEHFQGKDN
jgi:metal-responsive CopG/Arc/MetJ family transcriptional regulator